MSRTFKLTKNAASLGNPQVQSIVGTISAAVQSQASPSISNASSASPAALVPIPVSNITSLGASSITTISSIVDSIVNGSEPTLTSMQRNVNSIVTSYGPRADIDLLEIDDIDDNLLSARALEPFEKLTGISNERPEIVMLTNFLPLYRKDDGVTQSSHDGDDYTLTSAGRFMLTQLNVRSLRHDDVRSLVKNLSFRHADLRNLLKSKSSEFEMTIAKYRDVVDALFALVQGLEQLKKRLDLHDVMYDVQVETFIQGFTLAFSKQYTTNSVNRLLSFAKRTLPTKYSFSDVLVKFGYDPSTVNATFMSSKVWLQLLSEMKDLYRYHSLGLVDFGTARQKNSDNASTIVTNDDRRFSLEGKFTDVPTIGTISSLNSSNANTLLQQVEKAWNELYADTSFQTSETKVAALVNQISKEYRYSRGLSLSDVQRTLLDDFKYQVVQNGNVELFDKVIGHVGRSVDDVPLTNAGSLASVAQVRPTTSSVVLTFEKQFIESSVGTLTPGSAYYVDSVMNFDAGRFDTSRLKELYVSLTTMHKQFGTLVGGLNLLSAQTFDSTDKAAGKFSETLSDPLLLMKAVIQPILDEKTGITNQQVNVDGMCAVLALSNDNLRLRSLLFVYFVLCTMASDTGTSLFNTLAPPDMTLSVVQQALQHVIELIVAELKITSSKLPFGSLKTTMSPFFDAAGSYNPMTTLSPSLDDIKTMLQGSTYVSKFITSYMKAISSTFSKSGSLLNDRTRYSGCVDTIVMMMTFDALVTTCAKYGNQTFESVSLNTTVGGAMTGAMMFNIARTNITHYEQVNDMLTRIEREVSLAQQSTYVVMNALQKLSSATKNMIDSLESKVHRETIDSIASIVDANLLGMLMNVQQIYIASSLIRDVSARASLTSVASRAGDVDYDGNFDNDDIVKMLDDSVLSTKMKSIVLEFFKSESMSSKKGYNKKILTVGVPLGFTKKLQQKFQLKDVRNTSDLQRQDDVVNVVVYKIDVQNSDIVYKPRKFLFEMSRFPVRNDDEYDQLSGNSHIDDVIASAPMRDFGVGRGTVSRYVASTGAVGRGNVAAFDDASYSFLSDDEKRELAQNHVISYLLELYVKVMTGLNVGEHRFTLSSIAKLIDPTTVKSLAEKFLSTVNERSIGASSFSKVTNGALFTSTMPVYGAPDSSKESIAKSIVDTNIARPSVDTLATSISGINAGSAEAVVHGMRVIDGMSRMIIPFADPKNVLKGILTPKKFDRVFNVIIDPDEFEIDYAMTTRTPHGKRVLEQLIKQGDVTAVGRVNSSEIKRASDVSMNTLVKVIRGGLDSTVNSYRYRDRDRGEGDMTFEKYFVSIETYGKESI
jgi:uncharacterized protein YbdZ (MbtH family)